MKNYNKDFELFNIQSNQLPDYNGDPNLFMKQYEKCSVLEYNDIAYSNDATNPSELPTAIEYM